MRMRACVLVAAVSFAGLVRPQAPGHDELLRALAAMPTEPAQRLGIDVEVVDAAGKPCRDAVLVLVPRRVAKEREPERARLRAALEGEPFRYMQAKAAQFGVRYALDEAGRSRVPNGDEADLLAVAGEALACQQLLPEDGGGKPRLARLELRVPRRFHALVTTHDGKPAAGVGVCLAVGDARYHPDQAITADDGSATVMAPLEDPGVTQGQKLGIKAALLQPLAQDLPAADSEVVHFVLPPCGSVRIRLDSVDAGLAKAPRLRVVQALERHRSTVVYDGPVAAEGALLRHVQPGVQLAAHVILEGVVLSLVVPVPAVEVDQESQLTIDLEHGPTRVALRVVDDAGQPVGRETFRVSCNGAGGRIWSSGHSDAAGRLEVAPPARCMPDGTLTLQLMSGSVGPVVATAELPLRGLHPGRNDVGDLRMQLLPVLLSGRTVDLHGAMVAGVVVRTAGRGGSVRSTPSTDDGRFTIRRALPNDASVPVELEGDDFYLQGRPASDRPRDLPAFAAGSRDVRLVVRRAARMLVRMPPLPTPTLMNLRIDAVSRDGSAPFAASLGANATQLRLPPGRWDLAVRFEEGFDEVSRIEDVIADEGIENHDPRLLDFDWRKFANLVTVRATGPDGEPLTNADVTLVLSRPGRESSRGIVMQGGVAHALVPKDSGVLRLDPRDPTLCLVDLGVAKGELTVRVPRAPKVRVHLSAVPKLPAGCSLRVALATKGLNRLAVGDVDAAGNAEVTALMLGPQELRLDVWRGQNGMPVAGGGEAVDLGEAGLERRIELTEALRAAIELAAQKLSK